MHSSVIEISNGCQYISKLPVCLTFCLLCCVLRSVSACVPISPSFNSEKKKKLSLADEHDNLMVTGGLYRKLMLESRKKVTHNIDISPHISLTLMFITVLYMVSSYYFVHFKTFVIKVMVLHFLQ